MEYLTSILILVLYYLRPQDWLPGMAGTNVVKPVVLLGLIGLFTRSRGLQATDFFRTPIDWFMAAYSAYVILTAPDIISTFKAFIPFTVFYILTTQSLRSKEDLHRYLKWWTAMLVTIGALAAASLYGFDPTNGMEHTNAYNGRLSLGTYIHNNPNALGHSVVCAIPLLYYLLAWKSTIPRMLIAIPLASIVFYAAYRTESKGAYLVGGGAVVLAFVMGRGRLFQLLTLVAAFILGSSALNLLPRMEQMGNLRSDEGVQGRLLAWEAARSSSRIHTTGEGFKTFIAVITWEGETLIKATHGSYVRVGADLGYPGLFLFLSVLWCCIRALLYRPPPWDIMSERSRRMLFILLATYIVSGWMIDRSYHTEYFLIAAAISAYYRLYLDRVQNPPDHAGLDQGPQGNATALSGPRNGSSKNNETYKLSSLANREDKADENTDKLTPEDDPRLDSKRKYPWRRPTIFDLGVILVMTWATLSIWDYLLKNI